MGPGQPPSPLRSLLFRATPAVVPPHGAHGLESLIRATDGETSAIASDTVRLVPRSCGRDCRPRQFFAAVYFPENDVHVSMLAPTRSDIRWLTNYIYLT